MSPEIAICLEMSASQEVCWPTDLYLAAGNAYDISVFSEGGESPILQNIFPEDEALHSL